MVVLASPLGTWQLLSMLFTLLLTAWVPSQVGMPQSKPFERFGKDEVHVVVGTPPARVMLSPGRSVPLSKLSTMYPPLIPNVEYIAGVFEL